MVTSTIDVEYLGNHQRYRLGSKGSPIGNGIWAIEWSCDRWRNVILKGQTRDPNTLRAQCRKVLELETSNLVCSFVWGMLSGHTQKFPKSGRGLSHMTPTIFGIRSNISPKLLELETSNLLCGFVWGMPNCRSNAQNEWPWPLFRDCVN